MYLQQEKEYKTPFLDKYKKNIDKQVLLQSSSQHLLSFDRFK